MKTQYLSRRALTLGMFLALTLTTGSAFAELVSRPAFQTFDSSGPSTLRDRFGNVQPSTDDTEDRYIVLLKTPPVALRLNDIPARESMTPEQAQASIDALTAAVIAEQEEVLNALLQRGLILRQGQRFTYLLNGFAVTATPEHRDAIAGLAQVASVDVDHVEHITLGQSVPLVGAPAVWVMQDAVGGLVTGRNTKIAIIDTGVDYTHPDLGGCFGPGCRVAQGYDFVSGDGDPMDDHNHGTHVAGIVAANGVLKGVAPDATLLAYKVCDIRGSCYESNVIAGLERSVLDGASVANLSLSGVGAPNNPLAQAIDRAVDQGLVVAVGAGNNNDYRTIGSTGMAVKAVTVGATDKQDGLAPFTSKGPVAEYLLKPDLVAPGFDIYSTIRNGGYAAYVGTSMASPHVAGAAALLRQLHPNWTPAMVKANLMNSALWLGDPFAAGAGRLRVDQAAQATVLIQPGSVSFGQVTRNKPTWAVASRLEIRNITTATQTYALSIIDSLPTGASAGLSRASLTLNPGQTRMVTLSLTVDTQLLPYPTAQPYIYFARVGITNGTEIRHVPFAFLPPPVDCNTQIEIPQSECAALVTLYNSTNGPNWWWHGGWSNIPPCGWYAVTCAAGHVTKLNLYQNNLVGTIPPQLGNLTHLVELCLCKNYLNGSIPHELGNLTELLFLAVCRRRATGRGTVVD